MPKRRLQHRSIARLLLQDWFFCRPPTLSSIWSMTILLHLYRVFLLPANAPVRSPASISDFRCQSHQRDDALYPSPIYAEPAEKSTEECEKYCVQFPLSLTHKNRIYSQKNALFSLKVHLGILRFLSKTNRLYHAKKSAYRILYSFFLICIAIFEKMVILGFGGVTHE